MAGPFSVKLERFAPLGLHGRRALDELCTGQVRRYGAREDVAREGDRPRCVNLFLSGWACRYKQLRDGQRQIIAFLLPGDLCDLDVFVLREMDHSIATLTPVALAQLTPGSLERLGDGDASIARALRWETLVNAAIQREWTLNLGQRSALERIGHLFCELHHRLLSIELADEDGFELPLTQLDLAEATGLTPVHVNRTLQRLRAEGLIELGRRRLRIPDVAALQHAALFTPNYLHVAPAGQGDRAQGA